MNPPVELPISLARAAMGAPSVPDHVLIGRIGAGAYGEVWLARNTLGTLRAVKIVRRAAFDDDRPYEREFAGIQKFEPLSRSHEGFVDLLQVGRNDVEAWFYYVMELADDARGEKERRGNGEKENRAAVSAVGNALSSAPFPLCSPAHYAPRTLASDVKLSGALPLDECLRLALALTNALAELHRHGLVHRDIKPSNIIFVGGVPKLADVGLVAAAKGVGQDRSYVGTEGFIPPEGPGTPQADLYSLGIVLYVLSTGKSHRDFPEPPADLASRPDRERWLELQAIIHRACQADSRGRYADATSMLRELELLQAGQSVKSKRALEHRWAILKGASLAVIALAVLVVGAQMLLRQLSRPYASSDGPLSTNMEANAWCQSGLLIIRGDNYAGFPQAYTNFHKAIDWDPNFARPYVGLLELLLREGHPNLEAGQSEIPTIARKLAALVPHSAPACCAQSIMSWFDWDYPKAKRFAEQAIKADANYELGHTWYGFMLTQWGWPVKGRGELEIALGLAPSKVTIYRTMGQTFYMERDFTNAIAWERKALDLEPHHGGAFFFIGHAQMALGDYTNALDNLEKAELADHNSLETRKWYAQLRDAFQKEGVAGFWRKQLSRTRSDPNLDCYRKAECQIHIGNTNTALDLLNKSYAIHERNPGEQLDSPLNYLLLNECWDGLREDPRFKRLLDQIGYTKVMPR